MVRKWKMRPVCHICGEDVQSMIYVSSCIFHRGYRRANEGIGILWLNNQREHESDRLNK